MMNITPPAYIRIVSSWRNNGKQYPEAVKAGHTLSYWPRYLPRRSQLNISEATQEAARVHAEGLHRSAPMKSLAPPALLRAVDTTRVDRVSHYISCAVNTAQKVRLPARQHSKQRLGGESGDISRRNATNMILQYVPIAIYPPKNIGAAQECEPPAYCLSRFAEDDEFGLRGSSAAVGAPV